MARGRKPKMDKIEDFLFTSTSESKIITSKTERKPREKKVKLTRAQKRASKVKAKLGKITGSFGIVDISTEALPKYSFIVRYQKKGKKRESIKTLFTSSELPFVQEVGSVLSEELKFPYNSNPVKKQTREFKKEKRVFDGFEIDHSIFKTFNNECFLFLPFGSIFLNEKSYACKRNTEKLLGYKIHELSSSNRLSSGYYKCLDILKNYSEETIENLYKDIVRFGSTDDRNTIRMVLGNKPQVNRYNEESNNVYFGEVVLQEDKDFLENSQEEED